MACSAKKISDKPDICTADETWRFLINKIKAFYPYYIAAILIKFISANIILNWKGIKATAYILIKSVPLFTLTFYGLNRESMPLYYTGAWYLSAMIICLFILYPLLLKNFKKMTQLYLPLFCIFLLGFLWKYYNQTLYLVNKYLLFTYSGMYRAIAEISLGACLFPLTEKLKEQNISQKTKFFLTIVKYVCFFIAVYYCVFEKKQKADLYILLIMAIGITLSFSSTTIFIKGNNFTNLLSKHSLTLYIFHGVLHDILKKLLPKTQLSIKEFICILIFTLFASYCLTLITDLAMKCLKKIANKEKKQIVNVNP